MTMKGSKLCNVILTRHGGPINRLNSAHCHGAPISYVNQMLAPFTSANITIPATHLARRLSAALMPTMLVAAFSSNRRLLFIQISHIEGRRHELLRIARNIDAPRFHDHCPGRPFDRRPGARCRLTRRRSIQLHKQTMRPPQISPPLIKRNALRGVAGPCANPA